MGVRRPGDLIEVQHVLFAKVEANGAVSISVGDAVAEDSIDQNVPVFMGWGDVCLPAEPDSGQAGAECILWKTGGADVAFAGRDVRGMKIAGNMKMGERCVYAPGSQAKVLLKKNGGVSIMTTADNTETGQTVALTVDPDGVRITAPWGKLEFSELGFHATTRAGPELHMGGMSAPAPLNALGSYARISASIVQVEGSAVSVGAAGAGGEPNAKATTLQTYLTALEEALVTAVGAAGPGGPAAAATLTTTIATTLAPLKVAIAALGSGSA